MFSLVNYARFLHIDAETALHKANNKFIQRFTAMEKIIKMEGNDITKMPLPEMDAVWNRVKKENKNL